LAAPAPAMSHNGFAIAIVILLAVGLVAMQRTIRARDESRGG
jgi:hypothetical protein